MTSQHTQYEIFISYARVDNAPIPEGASVGWVTALRDHILEDHRRFSTEPLHIFFDIDEIKDLDDWRHRIQAALRSSKILLVCLSPAYFASKPCRWEWDEYRARQARHQIGLDSVAPVYFVEAPNSSEADNARWLDELLRHNYTDIRPWFPEGAAALQRQEVKERIAALGGSLWERIQRARSVQQVPGNVRRVTPYFVGRQPELRRLHEGLATGAVGVVTAVHGLGGQGKTELAVAYAHAWAHHYPVGLWSLAAEGRTELLPLIGELAYDPRFGFSPPEAVKNNPALLGHAVLAEIARRSAETRDKDPHSPSSVLLLLDNVSEPVLLAADQIALLPAADWLRIVATTRLGQDRLVGGALALLPVDSLDDEDALKLIREHQPPRDANGAIVASLAEGIPGFACAEDEAAAREIVRELGGFTLAVEQVAIFLGLNPDIRPVDYLAGLRARGLSTTDQIPASDATAAGQILHREKQLSAILSATLERLDEPAARTALQFAALLPPDSVPWPWLQALTIARHPELNPQPGQPDPWRRVKRRLLGLRLLTPGDDEVARIHRLVAAHMLVDLDDAPLRSELNGHLAARARSVYYDAAAPTMWELDALVAAVPALLEAGLAAPQNYDDLANWAVFASDKVKTYRGLAGSQLLLISAQELLQRLAASDPGNAVWQRDLSISYNRLGDLAVSLGDLPAAQKRFTARLAIPERLAASDPGNAAWQRDLSFSHNTLGDLAVSLGDLPGAQQRFTAGLAIRERLAASDPGNAQWQRDLWVSYWRLSDTAHKVGDPIAVEYWRRANQTIAGMQARGMHVSQRDIDAVESLKRRVDG